MALICMSMEPTLSHFSAPLCPTLHTIPLYLTHLSSSWTAHNSKNDTTVIFQQNPAPKSLPRQSSHCLESIIDVMVWKTNQDHRNEELLWWFTFSTMIFGVFLLSLTSWSSLIISWALRDLYSSDLCLDLPRIKESHNFDFWAEHSRPVSGLLWPFFALSVGIILFLISLASFWHKDHEKWLRNELVLTLWIFWWKSQNLAKFQKIRW